MQKTFNSVLIGLFLVTTLLWLSSYTHHSAIGVDHDLQKDRILHKFYRINWTGHGSILVGYGSVWSIADDDKPLEWFDPASVFFKPVNKTLEKPTFWNRVGFWFVSSSSPRPTLWVGIPSWLPVLILVFILIIRLKRAN